MVPVAAARKAQRELATPSQGLPLTARGVVHGALLAAEHDAVRRPVVSLELDAGAGEGELVALALALLEGELVAAPLPRVLVAVLLRVDDAAVAVGDLPGAGGVARAARGGAERR